MVLRSDNVVNLNDGPGKDNAQVSSLNLSRTYWKGIDGTGLFFYILLFVWLGSLVAKFTASTQLWPVVAGFIFFETINRRLEAWVEGNPKTLAELSRKNIPSFLNTSVSLIHSTIVSISAVGILVREWHVSGLQVMWAHNALFTEIWPGAYALLGVSCGYFAYDQLDMLRRHLYRPTAPSVLSHHAVLLTCFSAALYRKVCVNYMILTLVCEVHSVFLHWRKVVSLAGARRQWNKLTKLEWGLNWLTFFISRVLMHMLIFWKLIADSKKFPRGVEITLGLLGMTGLNFLNLILGQGLYKAYMREQSGISSAEKSVDL